MYPNNKTALQAIIDYMSIQSFSQLSEEAEECCSDIYDVISCAFKINAELRTLPHDPMVQERFTSKLKEILGLITRLIEHYHHENPKWHRLSDLSEYILCILESKTVLSSQEINLLEIKYNLYNQSFFSVMGDLPINELFAALKQNRFVKHISFHIKQKDLATLELWENINIPSVEIMGLLPAQHLKSCLDTETLSIFRLDNILDEKVDYALLLTFLRTASQLTTLNLKDHQLNRNDINRIRKMLPGSPIQHLTIESDALTFEDVLSLCETDGLESLILKVSADVNCLLQRYVWGNLSIPNLLILHQGIPLIFSSDPNHKLMARTLQYLSDIDATKFRKLLDKSYEMMDVVLANPTLRSKLNGLSGINGSGTQLLPTSCGARSIMLILNKLNLIPDRRLKPSLELAIYREISIAPGEYADVSKIIAYLKRFEIDLSFYIDQRTLPSDFLDKHSLFKNAYHDLLATASTTSLSHETIEENAQVNNLFFLVTVGKFTIHLVLVEKQKDQWVLQDPASGKNVTGSSIVTLMSTQKGLYSGIAFKVNTDRLVLRSKNEESFPTKFGFFTPKTESMMTPSRSGFPSRTNPFYNNS